MPSSCLAVPSSLHKRFSLLSSTFFILVLVNISSPPFTAVSIGELFRLRPWLLHADSAKSFVHIILAPITHACSMPHTFLARGLCSVQHYVQPLYNLYGVVCGWPTNVPPPHHTTIMYNSHIDVPFMWGSPQLQLMAMKPTHSHIYMYTWPFLNFSCC